MSMNKRVEKLTKTKTPKKEERDKPAKILSASSQPNPPPYHPYS